MDMDAVIYHKRKTQNHHPMVIRRFMELNLLDVAEKYFPRSEWSWRIIKSRQRSFTVTVAAVRVHSKIIRFSTALLRFEGWFSAITCVPMEDARQYTLHTLLHEFAHYTLFKAGRPYGHTAEFWTVLDQLSRAENCKFTQMRCGHVIERG